MSNCKLVSSQVVVNTDFTKNVQDPTDKESIQIHQPYYGTQMWAQVYISSNSDYASFILSLFLSNSIPEYMAAVKSLYQYLEATNYFKIEYNDRLIEKPRLETCTEADWAVNKETQTFTSDYNPILARCLVS